MIPKICHNNAICGRLIQTSDCILWTKLKTKPFILFITSMSLSSVTASSSPSWYFLGKNKEKHMKSENDRWKKNANVAEKMICLNFAERNTTTYNKWKIFYEMDKCYNILVNSGQLMHTSGLTGSKQTADRK